MYLNLLIDNKAVLRKCEHVARHKEDSRQGRGRGRRDARTCPIFCWLVGKCPGTNVQETYSLPEQTKMGPACISGWLHSLLVILATDDTESHSSMQLVASLEKLVIRSSKHAKTLKTERSE
jgi:hypothetical protein